MYFGLFNAALYEVNGLNPHNLRRVHTGTSVRQQVRDYKRSRSNKSPGFVSRAIDNARGYGIIGSVAAITVIGLVITFVVNNVAVDPNIYVSTN